MPEKPKNPLDRFRPQAQKAFSSAKKAAEEFTDKQSRHGEEDNPAGAFRTFRRRIYLLGIIIPFAAIGALIGYVYGYKRTLGKKEESVRFSNLPPFMVRSIIIGALAVFAISLVLSLLWVSRGPRGIDSLLNVARTLIFVSYFLVPNLILTAIGWLIFMRYINDKLEYIAEKRRYGTARFSYPNQDLVPFQRSEPGQEKQYDIYIGSRDGVSYVYKKSGHGLVVAGTRAGKGTKFIMPNLLGKAQFNGSWVVIDPKSEAYHYTHQHQREQGRKVIMLNPWELETWGTDSFNPLLAFAEDPGRKSLGNDMRIIAETMLPMSQMRSNASHFDDRARTLIMAMLMHLALAPKYEKRRELVQLFEWFGDLDTILQEMVSPQKMDYPENQAIVSNFARQYLQLKENGEREFASVVSTAQRAVTLYADRELVDTMSRNEADGASFSINELSQEPMIIYITIPPENLKTHAAWLRLIVSSCIKSILRNRGHRVGFILDEFYALGYMRDIEVGMGAFAGYGITLIPILQNLTQMQHHYPKTWETFIANAGFFNAFGLNDNTTTQYISTIAGKTSSVSYRRGSWQSTPRDLITADEVRRGSVTNIFSVIDNKPLANLDHLPWYHDPEIQENGNPERLHDA